MPLISSSIPNLINGVSQQPPALRLASQAEQVINCMPSPVEGLKKRPPMYHLAKLFSGSAGTNRPFVHLVERDGSIQYMVIIMDNSIKVCDLDGTIYETGNSKLTTPDGTGYLNIDGKPSETFRVASVGDFTFIVNREKKVAMADTTSPAHMQGGATGSATQSMVFIKAANYDTEYKVDLNGTEKTFTTYPAGGKVIEGTATFTQGSNEVTVNAISHGAISGDTFDITFSGSVPTDVKAGTYTATTGTVTDTVKYIRAGGTTWSTVSVSVNCTITIKRTLSTVTIANKLASQLNGISGFTVTNDDHIIKIIKDDGGEYTLTSTDSRTSEDTKAIKDAVDDLDDLPVKAYQGFIVRVQGSKATEIDDYYVKFELSKEGQSVGTFGEGVWKETVAPGIEYEFDGSTMPHVLVREVNEETNAVTFAFKRYTVQEVFKHIIPVDTLTWVTYAQSGTTVTVTSNNHGLKNGELLLIRPSTGAATLGVFHILLDSTDPTNKFTYTAPQSQSSSGSLSYGYTWSSRITGDKKTAPNPSFVGHTIQNLNLFRNRLIFIADENVILSATDSYNRFWPETVQTIIDSDPVDLSTGGTSINLLKSSISFANTLLLFSRHSQFRLDAGLNVGSALTPKTATITQITSYDMVESVDPIAVGRNTYFATPKGNFSGLREFFLPDSSGSVPLSEDVTSSIPRFIDDNLCTLISAVAEESIVMISADEPKKIYIYKFFFEEDTKLQSAWSYWEIKGDNRKIIGGAVQGSDLYVVIEYSDGVYLEKVSLRPEQIDAGTEIEILLDRKTTEPAASELALNNAGALGVETVITLPYPIETNDDVVVVGRHDPEAYADEQSFPSTMPANGTVIAIEDATGIEVNSSGVATNARTLGSTSDNITINSFPESLRGAGSEKKTLPAGVKLAITATSTSNTYTFLKLITLRHGQVIEPIAQTSTTITVPGDLGNTKFFIGNRYEMTYEFSTPYIKEQPQGGGVALAAGPKLQMRTWTVIFDESSAFELKVTPASRDTNTYPYNGVIVGEAPPLIGDPSVLTGSFRVPVMASNIDTKIVISSTSPLPCRFQSAEWEGFYHTRAKRQ